MSPLKRICAVISVGVTASALGLHMFGNLSECFYAVLPLLAFVWYLTGLDNFRDTLQKRLRPGVAILAGLFSLSLGVAYLFLDRRAILSWRFWLEVCTCLYYFGGAAIVLFAVRQSLLSLTTAIQKRRSFSPGVRILLCEVLPLGLFFFFAVPYAMAFAHVHRFKMPIVANPRTFWQRTFEEIEFTSADGTHLRGWWIPAKKASDRTLVICHGIAANRSIFLPFVEVGDWLDANVLMLDLRGHGESGGRSVTLGYKEKDDILAAVAWARRERSCETQQIFGLGISLGAASMAEAAPLVEPPLDGVILDSAFASTRDMTHSVLGAFPSGAHSWLLTIGLPIADWHAGCPMMNVAPEKSIERLRSPVLILHSRGDALIPAEHAQRLNDHANCQKRLCIFDSPGHADAFFTKRAQYKEEVATFIGLRVSKTPRAPLSPVLRGEGLGVRGAGSLEGLRSCTLDTNPLSPEAGERGEMRNTRSSPEGQ